jgi:hypothetical protein
VCRSLARRSYFSEAVVGAPANVEVRHSSSQPTLAKDAKLLKPGLRIASSKKQAAHSPTFSDLFALQSAPSQSARRNDRAIGRAIQRIT